MIKLNASHTKLALQFFKFAIVGGLAFFVDLGFFHLGFDLFHFGHYGSAVFSFPFASSFGWAGNRYFTFRGPHRGRPSAQWMRFLITTSVGFVINRGTFSALTALLPIVYAFPVIGLMAGTGAAMFFNFFAARRLVFR